MSVISDLQNNADTAKDSDEPRAADWLPQAHFGGVIGAPGPPTGRDDEPDPDDKEGRPTPPDLVFMLGFDPMDVDWDAEDPSPDAKEPDRADPPPPSDATGMGLADLRTPGLRTGCSFTK